MKENIPEKISFQDTVLSVQPRSNVWRYRLDKEISGSGVCGLLPCRRSKEGEGGSGGECGEQGAVDG